MDRHPLKDLEVQPGCVAGLSCLLSRRRSAQERGLSALSVDNWSGKARAMALMSHTSACSVSTRRVSDGPGFAVAVTEAQSGTVRVHLIGCLEAPTAEILTSSLEFLHEGDSVGDVEIDLSALTFIDAAGMSELSVNRLLLESAGWTVKSALPRGAELHLLDCAAWAGWVPPHLTCTDILHWKPQTSAFPPPSADAPGTVAGHARLGRSRVPHVLPFAPGAQRRHGPRSTGTMR